MGKLYDTIDESLAAWIGRQRLFFVGTAPSGTDGHVNVSPKGPIETLRVAGPRRVAYLDIVGSGAETIAHLRDNGRIVVMLCAFEGPPRIVRLHGHGEVVPAGDARFDGLVRTLDLAAPGATERLRSLVVVDVERIADSCGFGVPLMRYEGERPQGVAWAEAKLRKGGRARFATTWRSATRRASTACPPSTPPHRLRRSTRGKASRCSSRSGRPWATTTSSSRRRSCRSR